VISLSRRCRSNARESLPDAGLELSTSCFAQCAARTCEAIAAGFNQGLFNVLDDDDVGAGGLCQPSRLDGRVGLHGPLCRGGSAVSNVFWPAVSSAASQNQAKRPKPRSSARDRLALKSLSFPPGEPTQACWANLFFC